MSINDAQCGCCDWYKPGYGCTLPDNPNPDVQALDQACRLLSCEEIEGDGI